MGLLLLIIILVHCIRTRYEMISIHSFKCISLAHAHQRRAFISDQANKSMTQHTLQFADAVHGKKLQITPAILNLFRGNDFKFTPNTLANAAQWGGVVGCALSHVLLWQQVTGNTLIIEDDVYFHPKLSLHLNMLYVPRDWDVLIVNETTSNTIFNSSHTQQWSRYNVNQKWIPFRSYIINRRGADKLLQRAEQNGIDVAIDWFVLKAADHGVNIYVIDKPLFISNERLESFIR